MSIGKGWLMIIVVLVALAVLAPDSEIGGTIRDTFSQIRNTGGSLFDTAGRGGQDISDFVEE